MTRPPHTTPRAARPLRPLIDALESRVLLSAATSATVAETLASATAPLHDAPALTYSRTFRRRIAEQFAHPLGVSRDATNPVDTGVPAQVDLQVRLKGNGAYLGDNVYNDTAEGQTATGAGAFFPTVYQVRVQNDGPTADSFVLSITGGLKGQWRVTMLDSQNTGWDGGQNVIDAATTTGWNTGAIEPGAYRDIRFEVQPYGALGGEQRTVTLTAYSRNNPAVTDAVASTTTNPVSRTVEIRRQNFDASGVYLMTLQNHANVNDRLRVKGPAAGKRYTVRYFDAAVGGRDVTDLVTSETGWVTKGRLAPRQEIPLRVEIHSRKGAERTIQLDLSSAADANAKDFALITNRPSPHAGPDFFLIGAWSQPRGSMPKWAARGINTMVQYESAQATIQEWTQAAVDNGLYMIRRPVPGVVDDVGQKNLIAWAHPDEPDIPSTGHDANYIADEYAKWKAVDPDMPIFTNYSGGYVNQWQGNPLVGATGYKPLLDNSDWASSSIYPVNGWDRPDDLDASGRAVDRLEKYSQGEPQFAVLESSDQELPWGRRDIPALTPGQFRAQIWDSVIRGAKGIIYFPQKFKPQFSFDNTPPEIEAEMIAQHERLAALGPALISPADPAVLALNLPAGLEGGWRYSGGKAYFIVMNKTDQPLEGVGLGLQGVGRKGTVVVEGEGRELRMNRRTIVDSFAPYETHVYSIG
jgi:hypothetical protein